MATQPITERDLEKERQGIGRFGKEFGKMPQSPEDWDKVAEYAYGPGYTVRGGQLVPPPDQIPEDSIPDSGSTAGGTSLDDAFFRGTYGLIQFTEDPPGPATTKTVWLVDPQSKKLIPFLSETAFNNAMTTPLKDVAAAGGITKISLSQIGSYTPLADSEGIKDDGIIPTFETAVDANKIAMRYGKDVNEELHREAFDNIVGFLKILKGDPNSGVSAQVIDQISNDPTVIGSYINAFAYGNYQLPDIYRDLKRRQYVADGKNEYKNMKIIDESRTADQYYASPAGSAIKSNPDLTLPPYLGDIDTELLNYSVFNLPDEVYKTLVPPFDWTSPEGQAELNNIKSAYHDVITEQLEAATEQAKALADYKWETLTKEINRKYGIQLSNNAVEAWNQLDRLGESHAERGIYGTGMFEEAKDKYLKEVRKADERLREDKVAEKLREEAEYIRTSGTPEQIKEFLNGIEDPDDKAALTKYFTPSDDIKQFFSKDNLRTLYPDLSDEELEWYANSIIDSESGLYRSQLYQTLASNKIQNQQAKKQYQLGEVITDPTTGKILGGYGYLYKKALEEEKAYKEYSKAEPFSKPATVDTGAVEMPEIPNTVPEPAQPPAPAQPTPTPTPTPQQPAAPQLGTYVPSPDYLKYYTENDIVRYNGKIYLKPGVEKRWSLQAPTPSTPTPTPTAPQQQATGIYVPDPAYLKYYTENDLVRQNGKIYLKPGVQQKWSTTPTTPTPTPKAPTPPAPAAPTTGYYVPDPAYLKNYTENDLVRQDGKIYLKPGVAKKW